MFTRERVLDDVARAAGEAVGAISGLSRRIKEEIKLRVEETADRMDLVPRSDLDRLEALVMKQQERIDTLEKKLDDTSKKKTGK